MDSLELKEIESAIQHYFDGIYLGDVAKLKMVFHQQGLLFGDIKGDPYFKTAIDYIEGVGNRKSPKELGEDFLMKIESVELLGNHAVVKAHLPMLGFNYYDFLSLSKVNGNWKIVNKLFSHIEED